MKNILKLLPFIVLALVAPSCNDDDEDPELIVGKWNLVKEDYVDRYDGFEDSGTYHYSPGEFIEFKADGPLLVVLTDETFGGSWRISDGRLYLLGNADLDVPEDGFEIRKLTKSELQLHARDIDGTDYYESTIYLSK